MVTLSFVRRLVFGKLSRQVWAASTPVGTRAAAGLSSRKFRKIAGHVSRRRRPSQLLFAAARHRGAEAVVARDPHALAEHARARARRARLRDALSRRVPRRGRAHLRTDAVEAGGGEMADRGTFALGACRRCAVAAPRRLGRPRARGACAGNDDPRARHAARGLAGAGGRRPPPAHRAEPARHLGAPRYDAVRTWAAVFAPPAGGIAARSAVHAGRVERGAVAAAAHARAIPAHGGRVGAGGADAFASLRRRSHRGSDEAGLASDPGAAGAQVRTYAGAEGGVCRRLTFLLERDLFRKPVPTFRDHAQRRESRNTACSPNMFQNHQGAWNRTGRPRLLSAAARSILALSSRTSSTKSRIVQK